MTTWGQSPIYVHRLNVKCYFLFVNYVLYFPVNIATIFVVSHAHDVVYERNTSGRFGGLSTLDRP